MLSPKAPIVYIKSFEVELQATGASPKAVLFKACKGKQTKLWIYAPTFSC